jgi:hypothetical protein
MSPNLEWTSRLWNLTETAYNQVKVQRLQCTLPCPALPGLPSMSAEHYSAAGNRPMMFLVLVGGAQPNLETRMHSVVIQTCWTKHLVLEGGTGLFQMPTVSCPPSWAYTSRHVPFQLSFNVSRL